MALILSIETSASACSVALHEDGKLLKSLEVTEGQAHAARLATLINNIFPETKRDKNQLNAIAVSSGPGSYTGLRIGVSTAKGLCFGLNIPLIGVPTLQSLAHAAYKLRSSEHHFLCPMIDAKRMEVYAEVYDEQLNVIRPVQPVLIDSTSFAELLTGHPVLFFGDGSTKCKGMLRHPNAVFLDDLYPKAEFVGDLAWQRFEKMEFDNLIAFTPFYLKDFVAKKAQPFF
jgi:tRNA threonylcarbamoyladenosine biosynthesis protein TsaB